MTKANRRRRKMGGRPRIEGVTRDENGRISQRKSDVAERAKKDAVETEREARATVSGARQRVLGASEVDSVKQESGSVLGRLFLARAITPAQYEAGKRMGEDFQIYYGLTGIPHPSARAQDVSRIRGLGKDTDPAKARAASNRIMAIERELGLADTQGRPVTSICKRVVIMDDGQGVEYQHMRAYLKRGLEALIDYYQIERKEAA